MPLTFDLPTDPSTIRNFDFPLDPVPTEAERLNISTVSEEYNRDGSIEIDHMDPYFYMTESHIADPQLLDNAFLPHLKSPRFHRYAMQILNRCLHHPGHLTADDKGEPTQESHEYFNSPAVDIRTTARDCYFDIELPGLTDKAGININWTSSHSFIVEGEIPRPRISLRDELDEDETVDGWTDATGETIDPPTGLVSLSGVPKHRPIITPVSKSVTDNKDTLTNGSTTAEPKDKYPGYSHLVRCPGSGEFTETNGPRKSMSTNPTGREDDYAVPKPTLVPDESSIPTANLHHPPPMDEIALIHARTNSSKASSRQHRPHNDHDVKSSSARGFNAGSDHDEHPLPLVSPNPFDLAAPARVSENGERPPCQEAYTLPNPPSYFPNSGGPPPKTSAPTTSFQTHRHFSNSHPSDDILRPVVENGNTPRLVLAERMIGRYKRYCVLPGGVEADRKGTEAKLEAGVLTVRIPRRKDREGLEVEGAKVVVE